MKIAIPKLCLVVLIGPSGSGKTTFARRHFLPTEVISSDFCRGLIADDENDQSATPQAFALLHYVAGQRLAGGRLTVIDATNVQHESRRPLVQLAREHHCLPVAIVFDLPERVCRERNRERADREFGPHVVRQQRSQLRRGLRGLKREGFRFVFVMESPEEVEATAIERIPLWTDRRDDHGPFDIIGDIHGCCDELESLLAELGYERLTAAPADPIWGESTYLHPQGRRVVFLGDLIDRGPRNVDALRLVRNMVAGGGAFCIPGNHDVKLLKKLRGRDVRIAHGLAMTLAEIESLPSEIQGRFALAAAEFIDGLVSHYLLDGGRLVVAHAGLKQEMHGRASARVRDFALYGETTGETDEFGLPVRFNWAADYRGTAAVVYGHTPVPTPEWLNRTLNIDTGCVFGGRLTALRYPELELVSVPALRTWCEPARPFLPPECDANALTSQQSHDDLLDAADVLGKRIVATRLRANITIRGENAAAALEVMSRFAANPKWLIHLPPTMSPSETSRLEGYLEHPAEAFAYFMGEGIQQVVCEEKHMGSRAIAIVCADREASRQRFGVVEEESGIVYTRTGRRFFNEAETEAEFLDRLRRALDAAEFWSRHETNWVCLDCELMPWSAKAQELLQRQYAAVGAAGRAALPATVLALEQALGRLADGDRSAARELSSKAIRQHESVSKFVEAYRRYCWPVKSVADLRLAPFHVLATEGRVNVDRDHLWHMETLAEICGHDPDWLVATPHRLVDLNEPECQASAIAWWTELTEQGGEGMVVKPRDFIAKGRQGLVQPAVKCRGREYLRIIYGPDYTAEENLSRLRFRGLAGKRSLAIRELALGIEALERFVRREPLRRVHECVFGVLALESEPVDPRL